MHDSELRQKYQKSYFGVLWMALRWWVHKSSMKCTEVVYNVVDIDCHVFLSHLLYFMESEELNYI